MPSARTKADPAHALIEAALRGKLTETQAEKVYKLGSQVVTLALLAASKRIAELRTQTNERGPS